MPTARSGLAAAIVGNTLFALGGYSFGGDDGDLTALPLDVVDAYDIVGGSWSAAEPMATPRYRFAAVTMPS